MRPLPAGTGRWRARTHDNRDDVDDGDGDATAASVKDVNRITVMINWTVCLVLCCCCSLHGLVRMH